MNTRKAAKRVASICLKVAVFILICLAMVYLGQTTYRYTRAVFSDEAIEEEPGRDIRITIQQDVTVEKFAEVLEEKELIKDAGIFKLQMKMAEFGDTVKKGSYELNTSMTPTEMFKILSETNEDET